MNQKLNSVRIYLHFVLCNVSLGGGSFIFFETGSICRSGSP